MPHYHRSTDFRLSQEQSDEYMLSELSNLEPYSEHRTCIYDTSRTSTMSCNAHACSTSSARTLQGIVVGQLLLYAQARCSVFLWEYFDLRLCNPTVWRIVLWLQLLACFELFPCNEACSVHKIILDIPILSFWAVEDASHCFVVPETRVIHAAAPRYFINVTRFLRFLKLLCIQI